MASKLSSLIVSKPDSFRYLKNTSWLVGEKLFRMFLGFYVLALVTRYLGPERFGMLSYAQSYVGIFVAFASLGLDVVIVRELVKDKDKENIILGTAFFLKLAASITAILLIFVSNILFDSTDSAVITNLTAFMLVFQSFNVIDFFFQSLVSSKFIVISNSISFVMSSIIKILLVSFGAPLTAFVYALVLDSMLVAIGYIYVYLKHNKSLRLWKYDSHTAKDYLRNAWPLMFVSVSAFIYTRADQIMIKYMLNNRSVGEYAAAIRISEIFYFIPLVVLQSIFPKVVEIKKNGSDADYLALLEKVYKVTVWAVFIPSFTIAVFGKNIVAVLYGAQYSNSSNILRLLSVGIILNAVGNVSTKILYAEHLERKYLYRSILGIVANILLNYFLINLYGVIGAAMATLGTMVILYYIYDLFDSQLRRFYYMKFKCFIPCLRFNRIEEQSEM